MTVPVANSHNCIFDWSIGGEFISGGYDLIARKYEGRLNAEVNLIVIFFVIAPRITVSKPQLG
jgi:hypothetical protein